MRFEDMLDNCRAGLPGAADFTILGALRRAAAELTRQSEVWQQTLDPIIVRSGKITYDYGAPSGSRVQRISFAKLDGVEIDCTLREQDTGGMNYSATGKPRALIPSMSAQTFDVFPTPDATADGGVLSIKAVLVSLDTALTFPDDLGQEYKPGIVAGAKFELMSQHKGMPYYDPKGAVEQEEVAYAWIVRAKRRNLSGGTQTRVRPQPFR